MAVIGDFQEEHCHLLLISQQNLMSNLLCTDAIYIKTTKNFVPLRNDSIYVKLPPDLGMDLLYEALCHCRNSTMCRFILNAIQPISCDR